MNRETAGEIEPVQSHGDYESLRKKDMGTTLDDENDMRRLGKKQEMRRNFHKFSTLSFTCIIMATWEVLLVANWQVLQNGGRGGFFWSYVWTLVGFTPIIASLAEMSSM
jgi:choline transport protein